MTYLGIFELKRHGFFIVDLDSKKQLNRFALCLNWIKMIGWSYLEILLRTLRQSEYPQNIQMTSALWSNREGENKPANCLKQELKLDWHTLIEQRDLYLMSIIIIII